MDTPKFVAAETPEETRKTFLEFKERSDSPRMKVLYHVMAHVAPAVHEAFTSIAKEFPNSELPDDCVDQVYEGVGAALASVTLDALMKNDRFAWQAAAVITSQMLTRGYMRYCQLAYRNQDAVDIATRARSEGFH